MALNCSLFSNNVLVHYKLRTSTSFGLLWVIMNVHIICIRKELNKFQLSFQFKWKTYITCLCAMFSPMCFRLRGRITLRTYIRVHCRWQSIMYHYLIARLVIRPLSLNIFKLLIWKKKFTNGSGHNFLKWWSCRDLRSEKCAEPFDSEIYELKRAKLSRFPRRNLLENKLIICALSSDVKKRKGKFLMIWNSLIWVLPNLHFLFFPSLSYQLPIAWISYTQASRGIGKHIPGWRPDLTQSYPPWVQFPLRRLSHLINK